VPHACSLNVPVSLQPFRLWFEVPVHNITLGILEAPGSNNQGIAFPNPGPFLHGSLDSAHARDPVKTPHTDVICPHHQVSTGELLVIPFLRESYTDGGWAVCIQGVRICCIAGFFLKSSHSTSFVCVQITMAADPLKVCIQGLNGDPDQQESDYYYHYSVSSLSPFFHYTALWDPELFLGETMHTDRQGGTTGTHFTHEEMRLSLQVVSMNGKRMEQERFLIISISKKSRFLCCCRK
jgi:hypothetical protein